MKYIIILFVIGTILFLGLQCTSNLQHEDKSVLHKIAHHETDSIGLAARSTDFLEDTSLINVVLNDSTLAGFYIQNRLHHITSFPCNNCHSKPLETLKKKANEKSAHWDVHMIHAGKKTMQCNTCHNTNNLNELKSITGTGISLKHSYQLCGQCHSTQYKDWQDGTHGKRLGGWVEPRVVNSCVDCHNPHQPAFETRFPARTIK